MFAMYRYTIMCIIYVGLVILVYFLFCDHNMVTHTKKEAVVFVIVWFLELQIPVQSVPISC